MKLTKDEAEHQRSGVYLHNPFDLLSFRYNGQVTRLQPIYATRTPLYTLNRHAKPSYFLAIRNKMATAYNSFRFAPLLGSSAPHTLV